MLEDLYEVVPTYVDNKKRIARNKKKDWKYGYDAEQDLIVISKDGTLGEVYYINGIYVGLPEKPDNIDSTNNKWVPNEYPKDLERLKTEVDWLAQPKAFRDKWTPYIDREWDRREEGYWFMNNKKPTYITGSHYMYLQWSKIDMGLPHFREANRIFWIFWEACVADSRCYGMCYVKIRRSGFSFMASADLANVGTQSKNSRLGILSKTGSDAQKMFTDKLVPIVTKYPFFFKPIQDGMDKPRTELAFRVPATKLTKKRMTQESEKSNIEGLDTSIDHKATDNNAYDGEKLLRLAHDEASKWLPPYNIKNNYKVTKTCLRLGSKIIGKCMMGSTVNALAKGGQNFKDIFYDSDPRDRSKNGQTKSGLYGLFIPMEDNYENHIDEFGMPVYYTPEKPVMGVDGEWIYEGAITVWENECEALKHDADGLNEHLRQFPRTLSHAFRDESTQSLFNLTKIYQQIDYNDGIMKDRVVVRGSFSWRDGIPDSEVVWSPNQTGRFLVSWLPPKHLQNNVIKKNGRFLPGNDHIGAFGVDSYDISGTVDGKGSKGAMHGKTGFTMEDGVPSNFFFLEYAARPQTAEIFFEDMLMACFFYGMPMLAENNKARLLYHFKNRGYRKFSLNRPDKHFDMLSKSEKELGGIPSNSEDIINAHANGIETYIDRYVGVDTEGNYRDSEEMGQFFFNDTLNEWITFDITKRTKFDRTISSGYAIMATNRHLFIHKPEKQKRTIRIHRYDNSGMQSRLIND